jgi:hypothetical protein
MRREPESGNMFVCGGLGRTTLGGAERDPQQAGALRDRDSVVVEFDKEASQTRDYCIAKNATLRAARPDCLRLRSGQALTAQKALVRNDNQAVLNSCEARSLSERNF